GTRAAPTPIITPVGQPALGPPVGGLPPGQPVAAPAAQPTMTAAPPSDPAAAPPDASTPAPEQAPVALSPEDELRLIKKHGIDFLMPLAFSGAPAQLWADVGLDEMDRGNSQIGKVLMELNASKDFDSWFADLKKIEPAIVSVHVWFSEFYKSVKDSLA